MSVQSSEVIRLDLPATHKHLNILGACILEFLARVENIPEREAVVYNLQLAAHEACANIIDHAYAGERERRIMRALGEIKEEYRIALMLREIEELSYEEIAATLSISIGTVKSRIARGREELRRRVKDLI